MIRFLIVKGNLTGGHDLTGGGGPVRLKTRQTSFRHANENTGLKDKFL